MTNEELRAIAEAFYTAATPPDARPFFNLEDRAQALLMKGARAIAPAIPSNLPTEDVEVVPLGRTRYRLQIPGKGMVDVDRAIRLRHALDLLDEDIKAKIVAAEKEKERKRSK